MASYVGSAVGFLIALPITTQDQVLPLLYWEAGISVFILALAVIDHRWAALPPTPPSVSSAMHLMKATGQPVGAIGVGAPVSGDGNDNGNAVIAATAAPAKPLSTWALLKEMVLLLKNGQFMLLSIVYGITGGTSLGWSGVLNPLLIPLGFNQVHHHVHLY
jgi:hypothetical protein